MQRQTCHAAYPVNIQEAGKPETSIWGIPLAFVFIFWMKPWTDAALVDAERFT
jgi:hypothetical protein